MHLQPTDLHLKVSFNMSSPQFCCLRADDIEVPRCEEFVAEIYTPPRLEIDMSLVESISQPTGRDDYQSGKHDME